METDMVFLVLEQIVDFLKNSGGMSYPAIASGVIVLTVSFLKSNICGNWFSNLAPIYKRFIIGALGLASSCLLQISSGMTVSTALYGALIISGGAVLIFEFIISILPEGTSKLVLLGLNAIKALLGRFKKQEPPTI